MKKKEEKIRIQSIQAKSKGYRARQETVTTLQTNIAASKRSEGSRDRGSNEEREFLSLIQRFL